MLLWDLGMVSESNSSWIGLLERVSTRTFGSIGGQLETALGRIRRQLVDQTLFHLLLFFGINTTDF